VRLSLPRRSLEQWEGINGNGGSLGSSEVSPAQVHADNKIYRVASLVDLYFRVQGEILASKITVPAVKDLPLVKTDWLTEPISLDVLL